MKGKQEGTGLLIWEDGAFYSGEFKNDLQHGQGITSGQMEMFMKEIGKMESQMEWESCSISEENGDMKVSSKMTNGMELESTIIKMEPFTLEDLKMANFKDLEHSCQLMVKQSSNLVSGKMVN